MHCVHTFGCLCTCCMHMRVHMCMFICACVWVCMHLGVSDGNVWLRQQEQWLHDTGTLPSSTKATQVHQSLGTDDLEQTAQIRLFIVYFYLTISCAIFYMIQGWAAFKIITKTSLFILWSSYLCTWLFFLSSKPAGVSTTHSQLREF